MADEVAQKTYTIEELTGPGEIAEPKDREPAKPKYWHWAFTHERVAHCGAKVTGRGCTEQEMREKEECPTCRLVHDGIQRAKSRQ